MGMSVSWKLLHSYSSQEAVIYVLFKIAQGKISSFNNTIEVDFLTEK